MSKPCEDCESVRNLSFEPRVQGALCAGCAEKLSARVRELELASRPFVYAWKNGRSVADKFCVERLRRLLGLEMDRDLERRLADAEVRPLLPEVAGE